MTVLSWLTLAVLAILTWWAVTRAIWSLMDRSERAYQQRLERRRMGLESAAMAPPRASGTKHGRVS